MKYEVGQTFTPDTSWTQRAIFEEGHPRWHALTVHMLHEDLAERWLECRGVYAFHPVRRKTVRIRGRIVQRHRRWIPGLVFARFPGPPIRHRVTSCPFITGAITMKSGEWGALEQSDMRGIMAMRPEVLQGVKPPPPVRRGDRVMVPVGLEDKQQEVEVLEITKQGRVKFTIRMFGADVHAEAGLDRVQRLP